LLIVLILAACAAGAFPWCAALAFLPILLRGFAWFAAKSGPLAINVLGKSELFHACAFGVLLLIGMAPMT
jgi:hypothetical protein